MNHRRSILILWSTCGLLLIFITMWPIARGMIALNDDLKFVRSPARERPLMTELVEAWITSPSFRPLEIVLGRLCDPETLACGWVLPVQFLGLAVLLAAVIRLADILMPGDRRLAPLATLFILVSPATTCSLWQMDTCSQTWSAALGLWACLHAWRGWQECREGLWPFTPALALLGTFLLLLPIKETFVGWSLGIGACILAGMMVCFRADRASTMRLTILAIPVIVIPAAFLAIRMGWGAVGHSLEGEDGSRYQVELGLNTVVNLLMSFGASCSTGPYHVVGNAEAPVVLRSLPVIAALSLAVPCACCIEFLLLRGTLSSRRQILRALILCAATVGSLLVTCMVQSVSELYGLGFNAAVGLLLGSIMLGLLRAEVGQVPRVVSTTCMTLAFVIGTFGLLGRAHHLDVTWQITREGNRCLIQALSEVPPGETVVELSICFDSACRPDHNYGQYMLPLQQSMDIIRTMSWASRRRPGLVLRLMMDRPCDPDVGILHMPCRDLANHGIW